MSEKSDVQKRLSFGRAAGRTAIKVLPWELAHLVFVAAAGGAATSRVQMLLIVAANLLVLVYRAVAIATRGRSMHACMTSPPGRWSCRRCIVVLMLVRRAGLFCWSLSQRRGLARLNL